MRFYLGTHHVSQEWWNLGVPLFVSRRRLCERKTFPYAVGPWALDSGGFTELNMFGEWRTTEREYVNDVKRFQEIGLLEWVAPQDWMCEPAVLAQTGLTVLEHQQRTVQNFLRLRQELGNDVIPVLQGWVKDDYQRCWEMYEAAGVDLEEEDTVGLGTVCRRQATSEAEEIVRSLAPLPLHGFGVKRGGLSKFSAELASADSLAWSYGARRNSGPCPSGLRINCANCIHYALAWRDRVLADVRMEVAV